MNPVFFDALTGFEALLFCLFI